MSSILRFVVIAMMLGVALLAALSLLYLIAVVLARGYQRLTGR